MTPPDFNLLLDLDALLSEGSVAGAARRLHISAPAMSRRLARLRAAVGDPLFVAAGRGLAPTPRALALQARLQSALEGVRQVFTPDQLDLHTLQRIYTLRANDGFAGVWATRLAQQISALAPGVLLRFVPRQDKRADVLHRGGVDLDLGILASDEPGIHAEPLFDAGFVGVAREGHALLEEGGEISAARYAAWPHVSASPRCLAARPIDAALAELGLQRRIVLVAPGFQAAMVMAASSDFLTAMPEPFARWGAPHHRVRAFTLPMATPTAAVCMSWHARQHHDPAHRWLREQVRLACSAE
ncbi:LysR family transcriptional regulator [Oxalobacteraceae bacterium A2-2]